MQPVAPPPEELRGAADEEGGPVRRGVRLVEDGVAHGHLQAVVAGMRPTTERLAASRCLDGDSGVRLASAHSGIAPATLNRARTRRARARAGERSRGAVRRNRSGRAGETRARHWVGSDAGRSRRDSEAVCSHPRHGVIQDGVRRGQLVSGRATWGGERETQRQTRNDSPSYRWFVSHYLAHGLARTPRRVKQRVCLTSRWARPRTDGP